MNKITKTALLNSALTALYIIIISSFMYWVSTVKRGPDNNFLAPMVFLSLFVTSAGITGYLVAGKPVQMYLDGKKKEALSLLIQTLAFMFCFTVLAIIFLLVWPT